MGGRDWCLDSLLPAGNIYVRRHMADGSTVLEIEYPYIRHEFLVRGGEVVKRTYNVTGKNVAEEIIKDEVLSERVKKIFSCENHCDFVDLFYEFARLVRQRMLEYRDELELAIAEVMEEFGELNAEIEKLKRVRKIRSRKDFVRLIRDALDIMYDC